MRSQPHLARNAVPTTWSRPAVPAPAVDATILTSLAFGRVPNAFPAGSSGSSCPKNGCRSAAARQWLAYRWCAGRPYAGRQARMVASTGSGPRRAATTRTIATSSPSASRRNASAAPAAGPK